MAEIPTLPAPDALDVAVRAWAERDGPTESERRRLTRRERRTMRAAPRRRERETPRTPDVAFVFDCETTTDEAQALTFGCCRVYECGRLRREYLFYADDLPETNPTGYAVLHEYMRGLSDVELVTQSAFLEDVFWPLVGKAHALVIGFNLPFDLRRIARNVRYTKDRTGFTLRLWADDWKPWLQVWIDDSKRARIRVTKRIPFNKSDVRDAQNRGYFLDCRTLAFALTDRSYSLASACEAFGVEHAKLTVERHGSITTEYIDYCRRDVLATWELAEKLLARFATHPIALAPWAARSAASIGKAYLAAMGLQPRLALQSDFDRSALGDAMVAYYGGRVESAIRSTPMPVRYVDFTSMYPTVNALMGLWSYFTAARLDVADATADVRVFLDTVTLDALFEPDTWRKLPAFVEVLPEDDLLPVRAQYDDASSYTIGIQYLTSDRALVYTLADCIAAKLLTGKAPRVLHAWTLVPVGIQPGLQPVKLAGEVPVDPVQDDFFRLVIEARNRRADKKDDTGQFLKVLANSSSYGIYVEMNPEDLPRGETAPVKVYGRNSFSTQVPRPETPGVWCFPPLAATITGAARLMLALLERCVRDGGGNYVFCDTDSMAIVSSEHGGLVPCTGGPERLPDGRAAVWALPWTAVRAIVDRFAALNPYDRDAVPGSVLKIEEANFVPCGIGGHPQRCICTKVERELWSFSISSKRYALYTLAPDGAPQLCGVSAHGLGAYLPPDGIRAPLAADGTDGAEKVKPWHRAVWERIIRHALGLPAPEPAWFARPAMRRLSLSKPTTHRLFEAQNAGQPYARTVKPANFLIGPRVQTTGYPPGADAAHFALMAPFETDPERWTALDYTERFSGQRYRIAADLDHAAWATSGARVRPVDVETIGTLVRRYAVHPEAKRFGPDGTPCTVHTVGLLTRRRVRVQTIAHIGKESNALEERETGEATELDDVQTVYEDAGAALRAALAVLPERPFAAQGGISVRQLRRIKNGEDRPTAATRARLGEAAMAQLADALTRLGVPRHEQPASLASRAACYRETVAAVQAHATDGLRQCVAARGERAAARALALPLATLQRWAASGVPADPAKLAALRTRLAHAAPATRQRQQPPQRVARRVSRPAV